MNIAHLWTYSVRKYLRPHNSFPVKGRFVSSSDDFDTVRDEIYAVETCGPVEFEAVKFESLEYECQAEMPLQTTLKRWLSDDEQWKRREFEQADRRECRQKAMAERELAWQKRNNGKGRLPQRVRETLLSALKHAWRENCACDYEAQQEMRLYLDTWVVSPIDEVLKWDEGDKEAHLAYD